MRIALISDIHSNILALEAVLRAIHSHHPDCILSLGDQVNLGPCPRETLELLRSEGVICLHGNHERYILGAMQGLPAYQGANFNILHFQAPLLSPEQITFDPVRIIEGVTFCHALPNDDRFPVYDAEKALPLLRAMSFPTPTRIVCGHGHNPTTIQLGHLSLYSIGSVGCMDAGVPGTSPYAILTLEKDAFSLRPYTVAYDTRSLRQLFVQSGMADACPIMSHINCLQMMYNHDYLLDFVKRAEQLSHLRGESFISTQTWRDIDATYPWLDGCSTASFWSNPI